MQMSASTEILSDYKKTKEGLLYTIEEDSVTILGSGKHFKIIDRTLVIPDTVENLPVTKIGKQAFKGQTHFTKLSLPNQLQTIGAYAFSKTNIVKFRAPSSLEKLEIGAFNRCRLLKEVDLKYSKIETIKSFTFSACPNLKKVIFPNTLLKIDAFAFWMNKKLVILKNLNASAEVDDNGFYQCEKLIHPRIKSVSRQIKKVP